jgi:hypothetical protein
VSDLTKEEQAYVRAALRFLRARCGGWKAVAKALRAHKTGLSMRDRAVTASLAVRVARFVGVGVDDLLAGKFPPQGTCPFCGHIATH